jgi:hypothetical protein
MITTFEQNEALRGGAHTELKIPGLFFSSGFPPSKVPKSICFHLSHTEVRLMAAQPGYYGHLKIENAPKNPLPVGTLVCIPVTQGDRH